MSDFDLDGIRTTVGTSEAPAQSLEPGERFAERYEIRDRLGGGGMGVVYLASDSLTGEDVAIKLIHPNLVDTDARQRMIEEGVLARKVSHPNVVRVHDVGDFDGQIYLVMEVVKGRSLRTVMAERMVAGTDAPLSEVVATVRAILAGLAAAHAQNLVHRDVKPENVMLSGTPGMPDFRLKVLDFGIARGLKTGAMTGSRAVGTPLYMAPEQKTSPGAVGPSADIYSVGRIFYEMLLDVPPEGTWSPPSEQRSDVPRSLDDVLRKTQAAPRQRYQSVAEFTAALDEALAGPAVPPLPPRPEPAPAPDPSITPKPAPGNEEWRGVLRKIEDFDRAHNPGHALRKRMGFGEAQRLSEMSTGKVLLWGGVIVVIALVVVANL